MNRRAFLAATPILLVPTLGLNRASKTSALSQVLAPMHGQISVVAQRVDGRARLEVNAQRSHRAASVIKVPIMLTCMRLVDQHALGLQSRLTVKAIDLVAASDTIGSAHVGDTFQLRVLIKAMIQQSDNSASNTILSHIGLAPVNAVLEDAGMHHSQLQRLFMHFDGVHDNLTTAGDMADVFLGIQHGAMGRSFIATPSSCRFMLEIRRRRPRTPVRFCPIAIRDNDTYP